MIKQPNEIFGFYIPKYTSSIIYIKCIINKYEKNYITLEDGDNRFYLSEISRNKREFYRKVQLSLIKVSI